MRAFADFLVTFPPQLAMSAPSRVAGAKRSASIRADSCEARVETTCESLFHEISSGARRLWVVGELFRYRGERGSTQECATRFLSDVEGGIERADELAGQFAITLYVVDSGAWSIWTDRCGTVHVYLCEGPDSRAIGTYSGAVHIASARRLDWPAITAFLTNGFFPPLETHYKDVSVLQPSRRYDFDARGRLIQNSEYWSWRHEPLLRRGFNETVEQFGDTLKTVSADHASRGRLVLPLSGGLDSRTLAVTVPKGSDVRSYSYGYDSESVELRISREVAKSTGLTFEAHIVPPYLFDRLDDVLQSVEGFQDVTQARQASVSHWLGEHADAVLGGHWGDVFCDDMGVPEDAGVPGDLAKHALKKLAKRGNDWLIRNVCVPNLAGEKPEEVASAAIRDELDRLRSSIADPDFRIKVMKTRQWAFRWTLASVHMYQAGAYPRMPFFDPRIVDFFCTVPTEMVRGRRIQVEFLKRFAPHVARITWQAFETNLYWYPYFNTLLLPKRALSSLVRRLSPPRTCTRNWELQFLGDREWSHLTERLLDATLTLHDYVALAAIRQLLMRFKETPGPEDGYAVSMLLTLSAWLESFHKKQSVVCAS